MFSPVIWPLAHGRILELRRKAVVMGVLNVTPDSFSDGGCYANIDAALAQAQQMVEAGAAIIDIGGESTKPGSVAVDAGTEQERILPVIEALAARSQILLSVDTYREETARLAVAAGAHIVNDVWGLQREPGIARVAAETGAGLVIMHTGRERDKLADPIEDQKTFLSTSLMIARQAGVDIDRIVLDPGFGFAKETAEENLQLMARFEEMHVFERPLLAGVSRKRFIGAVTGHELPAARDVGSAAANVILRLQGAAVFRVHDVAASADALCVADAMIERGLTIKGFQR